MGIWAGRGRPRAAGPPGRPDGFVQSPRHWPALGCDFDAIPKCAQAQMDIEDFVSWDIDHLKV